MSDPSCGEAEWDLGELTFRRVRRSDHADLLEFLADADASRFQFFEPFTASQLDEWLDYQASLTPAAPRAPHVFVAVLKAEQRVIGECQLTIQADEQGEIGFAFHPQYAGRGYATRMVAALLGQGFVPWGLHRITAVCDVRNERSWRLMSRVGMRREGHFLHHHFIKGEWVDDFLYAMLADEWRALHGGLLS